MRYASIRRMKRTTVFLEERLESDLHALARRQKRPVASLVREALDGYVSREVERPVGHGAAARRPSVSGARSARREEILSPLSRSEEALMPLLCDTGILYAVADRDDAWHQRAAAFFENERQVLLAPVTVLPEVAYLLRTRLGHAAEKAFADSLAAGELAVENLSLRDLALAEVGAKGAEGARTAELVFDHPFLGLVDASIVAIAERLKLDALVTTDRRDFSRVRPRHVEAFRLLP